MPINTPKISGLTAGSYSRYPRTHTNPLPSNNDIKRGKMVTRAFLTQLSERSGLSKSELVGIIGSFARELPDIETRKSLLQELEVYQKIDKTIYGGAVKMFLDRLNQSEITASEAISILKNYAHQLPDKGAKEAILEGLQDWVTTNAKILLKRVS